MASNASSPVNPPTGVAPLDWAQQSALVEPVLAEIARQVKKRKAKRKRALTAGTTLALVIAGLLWAVPYYRHTDTLTTVAANRQAVTLSDGSRVEINARSSLFTDFRYGRRDVVLKSGEAFFTVASDTAHPFHVRTPAGTVTVTGTQFNVRSTPTGSVEVTLLEGSVSFERESRGAPIAISPGQQIESSKPEVRTLSEQQIESVSAWRQGRIILEGLTLGEATARMGAYHSKEITVPAELASLRLGGSCPLDDLKGFLSVLEESLSVSVLPRSDGSYRIISR